MDDDIQWQEEFKVRVSSDFDRLVAFATEMNKTRETSPKREIDSGPQQMNYGGDYRSHVKKDETRKMKNEKPHDYPADLSNERRIRMMMEEQSRKKHMEHQ